MISLRGIRWGLVKTLWHADVPVATVVTLINPGHYRTWTAPCLRAVGCSPGIARRAMPTDTQFAGFGMPSFHREDAVELGVSSAEPAWRRARIR